MALQTPLSTAHVPRRNGAQRVYVLLQAWLSGVRYGTL